MFCPVRVRVVGRLTRKRILEGDICFRTDFQIFVAFLRDVPVEDGRAPPGRSSDPQGHNSENFCPKVSEKQQTQQS